MNIQKSVQTCLTKYVVFSGRASRSEMWWFVLAFVVVTQVAQLINSYLGQIVSLALLLPLIAVEIRRMHDIGKSGWFILIPFYNIYLWAQPGQSEANTYGTLATA